MHCMEFPVGSTFGPYRITALLATSRTGEAYRAQQGGLEREVRLDVLSPDLTAREGFRERFRRDVRAAASLHHPNIVPLNDLGLEGERCYVVSEHVPGPTLAERLAQAQARGQRLVPAEVARVARAIGVALDYAHQHGVVHGYLTPEAIAFAADGEPVLGGFGLAGVAEGLHFGDWVTVPFPPTYLSPEQCRGLRPGPASDVYGLGAVLYEALTGQPPFVASSPLDLAVKQIGDAPPPPTSLAPDLPPAAEQVLLKALAKETGERWASAGELAGALEAALLGAAPPAPKEQVAPPMPETGLSRVASDLLAAVRGEREGDKGGRRGWWAQVLALLGAGLAVAQYVMQIFDLLNRPIAPVVRALPYAVILFLAVAAAAALLILVRPAPAREKHLARLVLALVGAVALTWGAWTCYDLTRPPKAVIIMVADFAGPKATRGVDWGQRIYQRVKADIGRLGLGERVEVRRVFEDYASSEQARAAGTRQKATLVLWGSYDDLGVSPQFEILRSARRYSSVLEAPQIDLVDFDLYLASGPQEMAYVTSVVLGLARYAEADYKGAVNLFTAAIELAPAVSAVQGQEVAYLYRGMAGFDARAPMQTVVADLEEAARRKPAMYQAHWGLAMAYTAYCTPTLTLDAALAEAQTVVRQRPADSMAYWLLGWVHAEREEWDQSAEAERQAVVLDPANGDAYAALARALEELGRTDEARAVRQQALEVQQKAAAGKPEDPIAAQDELGTAYFFAEQYDKAVAAYKEALRRAPSGAVYHRHLAGAYYWQSRAASADAPALLAQAIAAYEAAIRLDPYDSLALTNLANAYHEAGRDAESLAMYEKAVDVAPCDAGALFLLASAYDAAGRPADAEAAFRRLSQLKPGDATAWQYLATAAVQRGDYVAAEQSYRAAVQAAPGEADLRYGLATTLYQLGRYEEAAAEYRQATELAPSDAASFASLGDALGKLGRSQEAIAAYRQSLQLDPKNALVWVSLGLQSELGQDWAAAEQAYAEAEKLAPGDPLAHSARARALAQLKRPAESVREYEEAARLAPGEAIYQEWLAVAYAGVEELDKAVAAAEATLKLNPQSALAHLILAGVAEERGDKEKARAEYSLAAQYAGDNAGLKQMAEQGLARMSG